MTTDKNTTVKLCATIERCMKKTGLLDKLQEGCRDYDEYEGILSAFFWEIKESQSKVSPTSKNPTP
jgi:hypothetical protein